MACQDLRPMLPVGYNQRLPLTMNMGFDSSPSGVDGRESSSEVGMPYLVLRAFW